MVAKDPEWHKSAPEEIPPLRDSTPEADSKFRILIEALPDAILVHSNNRIVFINSSGVKLLGADGPDQLIGKEISEIIHPGSLPTIQQRIQEAYERRTANQPAENVLISLHGSLVPTEATAMFLTWEGQPAIAVVLRDIRQRTQAEENLRAYEQVFEGLEEMIVVVDTKYRYVVANRTFLNYRNLTREALVGRLIPDLLDKDSFEKSVKGKLDECFKGNVVRFEMKYEYPTLGERDLLLTYYPIESKGIVTGAACILQDITQRKRMDEVEHQWQQRLDLAQKSGLRIGLWDWDTAANTVSWSDETYSQFGFTRDTFSGRVDDAVSRIHPEDRPRVEAAIRKVLAGAAPEYAEQYRLVRPDASIRWIDAHGVLIENGKRMIGIGVDITGLKESEQIVQESEEKWRLLLNSTAEAIYGLDTDGKCIFCNPACLRALGYKVPEDLLGRQMHALIHHTREDGSPYPNEECPIYVAVRAGQATYSPDEILWRADGTSFPAEYWSYPMYKAGAIIGAVVTFLDRSERKLTEHALRESEEKYRNLFENATYGIFLSKPDGTMLDANPALVGMLGYSSKEDLLVRNLERDIYDDPSDRATLLSRFGAGSRLSNEEVRWRRKNGKIITVRVNAGVFRRGDGTVSHYEAIVDDITERRRLEDQYRQAQKMEAVGLLAGGISHDFNNLLGVIIGNADLLLEKLSEGTQRHHADAVKKAGASAAQLVRQLLAFSRKQVLYPSVLDLNSVVTDVVKILRRLIGEDVRVVTNLEPNLSTIRADRGQIEQILMNLATNARDAMPNGGTFTVRTENAELGVEDIARYSYVNAGRYVHLAVSDSGVGMSEEVRTRIFEPFFTTKEQGRGTGLGMSSVYGIVKQSGGYIWVSSTPGAGSTFDIYLPRIEEKPLPAVPKIEVRDEYPGGTETILLLEDEDSLRQVTSQLLAESGYTVLQAPRGDIAIELAKQHKGNIALIISDVVLPGMSGPHVVAKLQESHPETRALYVSGYAEVPITQKLIAEGAIVLQKPVWRADLLKQVDRIIHPGPASGTAR